MSNSEDVLDFSVIVNITDASEDELDRATRQLLMGLKDFDIEYAKLIEGDAPEGTMGTDAITIGAIALAVLPTVLPKIIDFFQAWMLRGQGRTVIFKSNKGITVKISPEDFQKILDRPEEFQKLLKKLKKGRKKK